MKPVDFHDILQSYLSAHPINTHTTFAILVPFFVVGLLILPFIIMAFLTGTEKAEDIFALIFGYVSIISIVGGVISTIFYIVGYDVTISRVLSPGYMANIRAEVMKEQMTLIDKCHAGSCLMSPSTGNGGYLGSLADRQDVWADKSVYNFVGSISGAYAGFQYVSGQDVLQLDRESSARVFFNMKFLSVIMRDGHAMLFVELTPKDFRRSEQTEKGIYEVSVFSALSTIDTKAAYVFNGVSARQTEFENSVGR